MCLGNKKCDCEKPCVLVVDDKADIRDLLRAAFELGGFCVETARTVGEVVTKVNEACEAGESCFDAIIMDIDLPDVTGTTLGKWIRERYPNVVVHYLTAYAAPLNREEAKRQGAGITEKPLQDPDEANPHAVNITDFVALIRSKVDASLVPGDRRKRGSRNDSGQHRRLGDSPIVPSATLMEHVRAVANARKGA